MSVKTVLLLDADILAFQVASSAEVEIDWGDDLWTLHSDLAQSKVTIANRVDYLLKHLKADEIIFCFTGPENFRKDVYPQYKSNRKAVRKPLAYKALVEHCKETYQFLQMPKLEADDVMGIKATDPQFMPEYRKIIVSEDKDLKTIQGAWLYNPAKSARPVVNEPDEAYHYFLEQTLTGDPTDGYPGCPGIGAVRAKAALDKAPTWGTVVSLYVKAGFTEEDALVQARCARILHNQDYDSIKQEVILWTPM